MGGYQTVVSLRAEGSLVEEQILLSRVLHDRDMLTFRLAFFVFWSTIRNRSVARGGVSSCNRVLGVCVRMVGRCRCIGCTGPHIDILMSKCLCVRPIVNSTSVLRLHSITYFTGCMSST